MTSPHLASLSIDPRVIIITLGMAGLNHLTSVGATTAFGAPGLSQSFRSFLSWLIVESAIGLGIRLTFASLVLAACSTGPAIGDSQGIPIEEPLDDLQSMPQTTLQGSLLAQGEFSLTAENTFGDPGFHAKIHIEDPIIFDGGSTTGWTLSILLFDLGRPDQRCTQEHPLSGCATVDWSDAENRPNVPVGGVFENSLRFASSSGEQVLYLGETGSLEAGPDAYDPGWPHTAIGGTAREWQTQLSDDLLPNSSFELNLVMTKFDSPSAKIGYETLVSPPGTP